MDWRERRTLVVAAKSKQGRSGRLEGAGGHGRSEQQVRGEQMGVP